MNVKKNIAAVGVAVAGVALALAAQGSAQAASAPQGPAVAESGRTAVLAGDAVTSRAPQGDWHPPAGYVLKRSFLGTDAVCRKEGDRGVAGGQWRQYVCHEKMVKVADLWMLYQYLYVKK
ncbi:hypothetical protein [Streptomyces sp. C184]|uniref:hypothetical protein n=1 Tax=Streptomyces sp. C184 TaxID=3237121 RepID=UPI0034C5B70A